MNWSTLPGLVCLSLLAPDALAQTTVEIVATRDTTLYEDFETRSNGAGSSMIAGAIARGSPRRALLAFDDLSELPAEARVLEAELRMEMILTQGATAPVSLHQVLVPWGEAGSEPVGGPGQGGPALAGDATWLHREFDDQLWDTPGGDFEAVPVATAMVAFEGPYAWSSVALAELVQAWVGGEAANEGLMLVGDETAVQTTKHFSTREGTAPPTLVVTFDREGSSGPVLPVAGLWADLDKLGEGYNVIQSNGQLTIFYFGHDSAGNRLWLISSTVEAEPRAGETIRFALFRGVSATFDIPPGTDLEEWGFLDLTVLGCTEARFELTGADGSKTSAAEKLASIDGNRCDPG